MNDGVTMTRGLLYVLPIVAWTVPFHIDVFTAYEFPSIWLIALMPFPLIWSPVSDWLIRHSNKHQHAMSWKDPANIVIALVGIALILLPVGWAVERLAGLLGDWVRTTWFFLCAALLIASIFRRVMPSTTTNRQEK
jgi:hypothetical protein